MRITTGKIKKMYMPDRTQVILPYQVTYNSAALTTGLDLVLAMNYVYLPGGIAPISDATYSAQSQLAWAGFYNGCFVGASAIDVKITNNGARGTINNVPIWVTLVPWDFQSLSTGNSAIMPYKNVPYNKHKLIPYAQSMPISLKHFMTIEKFTGRKHLIDNDAYSSFVGTQALGFNTFPTDVKFWHIYVGDADNSGKQIDVTVDIKVKYYCTLFDRKQYNL